MSSVIEPGLLAVTLYDYDTSPGGLSIWQVAVNTGLLKNE